MTWSKSKLHQLQKSGKIRGFKMTEPVKQKAKITSEGCKEVQWMRWNLQLWCDEKGLTLDEEYRFCPDRKFRFDFCIQSLKIGIEYEGLNSEKSGHTTLKGFTKDTEKYNLAQSLGWNVIRVTVLNYKKILQELEKI